MIEAEMKGIQARAMQIARLHLRIKRGIRRMARPKILLPKTPSSRRKRIYLAISNAVWRILGRP